MLNALLRRSILLGFIGFLSVNPASGVERDQQFLEVEQSITEEGSVRVIVELGVPSALSSVSEGIVPSRGFLPPQAVSQAQSSVVARHSALQAIPIKRFETLPVMVLEATSEVLSALSNDPSVSKIYKDELSAPTLAESSTLIGAQTAYSVGVNGTGQTIAILDTGVATGHPFFAGKIVSEACYSSTYASNQSTSVCPNGVSSSIATGSGINCSGISACDHGTHVAGIAAGSSASQGAYTGIASGANIIAIQVFSRFDDASICGSAANTPCVLSYSSDQLAALERVYSLRNTYNISSVNLSLGGGSYTSQCDGNYPAYTTAVENLKAAGIATVISSGNSSYLNSIGSPGCITSAITVGSSCDSVNGACGAVDHIASYSNMSAQVDLVAPGSAITSSVLNDSYGTKHGTSMAAPVVAGVWALMKQVGSSDSVDEILTQLQNTGVAVPDQRIGGDVDDKKRVDLTATFTANSDSDGLVDVVDNCKLVANADQRNTDSDRFGNLCDPDLDGSSLVGFADAALLKTALFGSNANADFNADGVVNFSDAGRMKLYWAKAPGSIAH